VSKEASHENRDAEQADDKANWQHDYGDAKAKADHHHHESNHDRGGMPQDVLDASHPSAVPPSVCVRHDALRPVIGKVDARLSWRNRAQGAALVKIRYCEAREKLSAIAEKSRFRQSTSFGGYQKPSDAFCKGVR